MDCLRAGRVESLCRRGLGLGSYYASRIVGQASWGRVGMCVGSFIWQRIILEG